MTMNIDQIQDGIHFGLPAEVYHAIPAISSSGVKNLLISLPDFWARSWMNKARNGDEGDEAVDDNGEKKSFSLILGDAYHKRVLEGKELFDQHFAPKFIAPENCLDTMDDMKDVLRDIGQPLSGKKQDLIDRILIFAPQYKIYDVELEVYEEHHKGKTLLPTDILDSIELAAAMIEKHPELSRCFRGGFPEVSVIWTIDGVRYKARFDYLKPKAVTDLKTFANKMNKPIDNAIYYAMAQNKYHIQGTFYLQAAEQAQKMAAQDGFIHQHNGASLPDEKWIKSFIETKDFGFYFVFWQKGVAPLARGWKFPRHSMFAIGEIAIRQAVERFKEGMEKYGTDIWIDDAEIQTFEDERFPTFAAEM